MDERHLSNTINIYGIITFLLLIPSHTSDGTHSTSETMLRIALTGLALWRATLRIDHFRSTIKPVLLLRQKSSITAFNHKPKVHRLDGQCQEFSVFFDEHGILYKLGVTAPHYLSFYGVWGNVFCWLRNPPNHQWKSKDVEVVSKIVNQVCKMRHLQSFKEDGKEIIPVENREEADYLSENYGIWNGVFDIEGSLTKLQGSLEAGQGQQDRFRELGSLLEKECELGWGIKMRLCRLDVQK